MAIRRDITASGMEGDGTLESVLAFMDKKGISMGEADSKLPPLSARKKTRRKKKRVAKRPSPNPLNPNGYNYGYVHIVRG